MGKVVIVLAGLFAVGCAGSAGEMPGGDGAGSMGDDLAASVEASVSGDSVRLLLHVSNTGRDVLDFRFPTSQRYDFVVEDARGEEVWRWSDGMGFTQALTEAELAPGETWNFQASWTPEAREGTYRLTGWITATERNVRQSTTFEIP